MSKLIILIFIASLVSACGGGSSTPNVPNPATSTTTIDSYRVTGTSASINDVAPINANLNNGEFSVGWNISSSDPYHVDIYLSDDVVLGGDVKIFEQNCGSLGTLYNCDSDASFNCRFDTSNNISCGVVSASNPAKDLTTFLDTIPKSAHLILVGCNALLTSCKSTSLEVELQ